jgi:RimJ/RimL family protein N-acetyltransferase
VAVALAAAHQGCRQRCAARAIHVYEKLGFRPVGVMRQYERVADGSWRDGLLMELIASEFAG